MFLEVLVGGAIILNEIFGGNDNDDDDCTDGELEPWDANEKSD